MQRTLLKHIVSLPVCKWNRTNCPLACVGRGAVLLWKKLISPRPPLFFAFIMLLIMGVLLLLASLRPWVSPSELLVAWGDDGALPAVCYSNSQLSGERQYNVLCPGSISAANQLIFALERSGCAKLENVFTSNLAPAARGALFLLRRKPTLSLVQLGDARWQKASQDLSVEARAAGITVRQMLPQPEGEVWQHEHWEFFSRREKNGDLFWSFHHLRDAVKITLLWQKNGVLQLRYQERQEPIKIKQFPRSNRVGVWRSKTIK